MTQMESPKRKMQKRNDYQRHKLFRKIKRRRKAQAEAEQQIAVKQLRKKLKLPKFDRGEDELSTYKKQVEMFNDANSDPTLPGRLVDRNRVTVNPKTGDVMEAGGHVNLDPVIITGKMPDNLKRTINKNIESDRISDLLYKAKSTNSSRDWQNVINLENHIRNSLKYLPTVVPFAIGAKSNDYNSGKDIHIKPSKRGTFTKVAKGHGMSVQGFANRVLRNPSKYSAAMRKKANFAHNAAGWKH